MLVCCLLLPLGCFKLLLLASGFQLGKSNLKKVNENEENHKGQIFRKDKFGIYFNKEMKMEYCLSLNHFVKNMSCMGENICSFHSLCSIFVMFAVIPTCRLHEYCFHLQNPEKQLSFLCFSRTFIFNHM